uniref:t-SNARE coiled-coil homology domain-containing protein n=1 Tax=Pseudictyota dubia TaxID=2749911 RepID=A0A7R9WA63_9STRA|mmetsp:Transcript_39427/g.72738  ORF Transcript_39427/g.72738 Transcript_39427/m.72738 type:complete len:150 (+) Transcript_39427:167-616(+)
MHQRRTGRGPPNQSSNGHYGGGGNMYGGRGSSVNPGRLEAGGGMSASEMNAGIMEQQNNDRINELSEHVARLKGLTIDIGNEVKEQNGLLDNMGDNFGNVGDMLSGSLRRIGTMLERGGAKHMCYMIGFVVFVMCFLYWIMTHKGQSGA